MFSSSNVGMFQNTIFLMALGSGRCSWRFVVHCASSIKQVDLAQDNESQRIASVPRKLDTVIGLMIYLQGHPGFHFSIQCADKQH